MFKNNKKVKKNKEKVTFNLYSCRKDCNNFKNILKETFEEIITDIKQNKNEFYLTLSKDFFADERIMTISVYNYDLDEYFEEMANYFRNVPLKNKELHNNILRQIKLFNHMISISFEEYQDDEEEQQKVFYIMSCMYKLAEKLTAFLMWPSLDLYDYKDRLLISSDGETDFEKFNPIASSSILEKDIEEEPEDIERRQKSIAILKEKNIPYLEKLKCAVYEKECDIWSEEEIINRLTAIFATSIKGEISHIDDFEEKFKIMLKALENNYNVSKNFTIEEKLYINDFNCTEQDNINFSWKYECIAVLLWSLSLYNLNEPTDVCDVPEIANLLWSNNTKSLLQKAKLKSKQEILDLQDLILRYHWACVEARINNKSLPQLNEEVVSEWHYALNWLVKAYGIKNWDKVEVHT